MKKLLLLLCAFVALRATAQTPITEGSVLYSLPKTSIKIRVEVEKEIYAAGPYAQYSQKYLSIAADTRNHENYFIKSIEMMPFTEADANAVYSVNFKKTKNAQANFAEFSSQGLIVSGNYKYEGGLKSRFAVTEEQKTKFLDSGSTNFTNKSATYYSAVRTDTGMVQIPVERMQKTSKSPEAKAKEVADLIFDLREKRIDIVSGESDFTGEGVKSALDEISRLEKEYMSLFIGKKQTTTETVYFDVVPDEKQPNQTYIAFRFSEKQGLAPAQNISGRPVMLELEKETSSYPDAPKATEKQKMPIIYYRVPRVAKAVLIDGTNVLLQDRFPIFQFGNIVSMPADLKTK